VTLFTSFFLEEAVCKQVPTNTSKVFSPRGRPCVHRWFADKVIKRDIIPKNTSVCC